MTNRRQTNISDHEIDTLIDQINSVSSIDLEEEWNKFNSQTDDSKKKRFVSFKMIAAAIILLTLSVGGYLHLQSRSQFIVIETAVSEHKQIILPDSSIVHLWGNSSIKYRKQFLNDIRKIDLNGHADFDVTHNLSVPFVVNTPNSIIRVLGTKFNISSFADQESSETTLIEGSIKLSNLNKTKSIVLLPQQSATTYKNSDIFEVKTVDTSFYTEKIKGQLVFINTPLSDALKQIGLHYGVRFKFNKSDLEEKILRATFPSSEEMDNILLVLVSTFNVKFEKNGSIIVVSR